MAEGLRSIANRISWSSLLRAVLFAAVWWVAPYWLFLAAALYLYYVPMTGAGKVSAPFWVLMLIAFIEPQSWFFAIVLAAVFYFILLIKDLLIIDRRTAYEVLIFVLSYLLMRDFFVNLGGQGFGGWAFLGAMGIALALTILFASFTGNFSSAPRPLRRAIGWMTFVLLWQVLIVTLFLPLDVSYQAAIAFLLSIALMSIVSQHIFGELTRAKALATSAVVFASLTIILASATWTL